MNYRSDTKYIHGGQQDSYHGSLSVPIFQTSTFSFPSGEEGEKRFAGEKEGYIYSRLSNPTVRVLEERIAAAEAGERGLAFASGMAAISAVLMRLTKAGDHILCTNGVYGCTYGLLQLLEEKYQITSSFCEMKTEDQLRQMIQPNTSCLFIETPINPTMTVIDLRMAAKVAHEQNIPVVVDNTFSSPYLQQPLAIGCDIVVHSATKYLCGHGDVVGGLVAGKEDFMINLALTVQKDVGGIMAPFDAWLLLRGMKTLPVRMDRHSKNAHKIVEKLKVHPAVKEVYYPADKDHPERAIVEKQMSQGGGIISFKIEGEKTAVMRVMNQLKLIQIAVSLGDAESLIQHPATMTHSLIPKEEREKMGIDDSLLRLSVGLEDWEDIWQDLQQALQILDSKS
ncbi:methionine gamma-lyase [Halobacillus sp. Marseille-Q1614]|uniref:methionine gamma-lyase n=1 Tax=Halobacillus sp. Marseille-Q1614 TaxID=2709134 RepID=UPI00156E8AED|nr:methionine gamma-lyase [Halobacillus sp. Marseille-Q1614]